MKRTEFLRVEHDGYEAVIFAEFNDSDHLGRVLCDLLDSGYSVFKATPEEFQSFDGVESSKIGGVSSALSVIRERVAA